MLAHSVVHGVGHSLREHLNHVAATAREFGNKFGAGDMAYLAGLWHDLGKFNSSFQEYILDPARDRRRGLERDHASAGALHAQDVMPVLPATILAHVIAGHHTGLADRGKLEDRLERWKQRGSLETILRTAAADLPDLASLPEPSLPEFVSTADSSLTLDLFIRMLFSVLTDADFLDTERHFTPETREQRRGYPSLAILCPKLEAHVAGLASGSNGPVHRVRQEVYRDCLTAAELSQGIFRLTVPTGGGKTLSGLAFALRHALRHNLDRVVVAIPYTSIIEQTADCYREALGAEAVLEHHSGVEVEDPEEDLSERRVRARLASQNWDAPIVVTTTVQLFDSIFANRSSRLRKLHNLARSVLVLDEVQTLPPPLLEPILDVLRELAAHYATTVVLCSATLPTFQDTPYLKGLPDMREIVAQPERHFQALKRVRYTLPQGQPTWEQVAEQVRAEPQCLAVVNTKNDALSLLDGLGDPEALHLSTLLCGAHRREVLARVHRLLKAGQPCRLVATQVVEAGVDLDFPVVFRAIGPMDRIVQAAGRCNREGLLPYGRVVVFDPAGGGAPPGPYRAGLEATQRLLGQGFTHLDDPALHRRYFEDWFRDVDLDKKRIQGMRQNLWFEEVARAFQLIDDDTVPALVEYPLDERARRTVDQIRRDEGLSREALRTLQPYLVGVRKSKVAELEQLRLLASLTDGLYEWTGRYEEVVGIGRGLPDPERFIV